MGTSPHELRVTRYIDASPQRVFDIWVGRLADWWAPRPWTTEVEEMDLRAGGRFASTMRGPEGEAETGESVFLEVEPGRRIVFTTTLSAGWIPQSGFMMVADFRFEPEGTGTRYTAAARHWDAAALTQHREMGFEPGWTAVAEQLAALAEGR